MSPARFSALVSGVLIVGVVASASLMALGFAGSLIVGWDGSLLGRASATLPPTDYAAAWEGLLALRPIAMAQAGLIVLIATPVLRVLTSVIAFSLEGDRLYAAMTGVVLTILLVSLILLR